MAQLSLKANEKSTYIVSASFTDENGSAFTPNASLIWTLTDETGASIDSASLTSNSSVDVILQGSHLAITASLSNTRYLTFEGTYDSSSGSNLPLKVQCSFNIDDLVYVT